MGLDPQGTGLLLALAIMGLLSLAVFRPGPLEEAPRAAGVVAIAWLYCGLLASTVVGLRFRFGFGWVILVFVVAWANDTVFFYQTADSARRSDAVWRHVVGTQRSSDVITSAA